MSTLVTVVDYTPFSKGTKVGEFTLSVHPWKAQVSFVQEFRKGENRWFNFPSKFVEAHDQKRYVPIFKFDLPSTEKGFMEEVKKAVDAYLAEHPELEPKEAKFEAEELPF